MTKKNRVATIVAACIVIAAGVTGSVYAAVTVAHDKEEAESSTVITTQAETSTEATTEAVIAATTEVVTTTPATTTTTAPVTQTETTTESTTVDITGKMTREQFEQIELGMTPEEVVAIVGSQPSKIMENNGKTAYSWVAYDPRSTYPDPYSEIVFEDGVVVSWMFIAPIKW